MVTPWRVGASVLLCVLSSACTEVVIDCSSLDLETCDDTLECAWVGFEAEARCTSRCDPSDPVQCDSDEVCERSSYTDVPEPGKPIVHAVPMDDLCVKADPLE